MRDYYYLFLNCPGFGSAGLGPLRAGPALQPVHPERVLGGRVGQHHVWVVEHVQSVQGQRVDLQLVQGKLSVCVKADVAHAGQRVGQLLGEARRGLPCDWDTRQRDTAGLTSEGQTAGSKSHRALLTCLKT